MNKSVLALRILVLTSLVVFACGDEANTDPGDQQPTQDAPRNPNIRDAGVSDARAPDAQLSSASGCAAHDYALCEDFESAATGALPNDWTVKSGWNAGKPMVTDAEHHGGRQSLKAAVATNGQPRASKSLSSLGELAGKHWGRVYYKVKTPAPLPAQGAVIHNTIVALQGSTEARVVDTVVNPQGKHQFLYNLPDDSCCTGSAYDYTSYDGQWHCVEWHVDVSTQTFRFFFEGTEVKSIGFSNIASSRSHIEQFSAVTLGWINYQTPSTPYEAWFDDLAMDDQQIGCK